MADFLSVLIAHLSTWVSVVHQAESWRIAVMTDEPEVGELAWSS